MSLALACLLASSVASAAPIAGMGTSKKSHAGNAQSTRARGRAMPHKGASAASNGDEERGREWREAAVAGRARYLCPEGMVPIGHLYCVDKYEASLVEIAPSGDETSWSPFDAPTAAVALRAVSRAGVMPQGYISGLQAREACELSGKRLCLPEEWKKACMGPKESKYPYGNDNEPRRCNDSGQSPMQILHHIGDDAKSSWKWGWNGNMMDPRLNQMENTLARTGDFSSCTNEYGVFDMVGNLHEWVDDRWGTFQGGYYLDTHENEDGCYYRTTVHPMSHADYSTGFRCCADLAGL